MEELGRIVEIIGILVMLFGIVFASVVFLRNWRRDDIDKAFHQLRANLGRAILLGLEFMVVGDIINTVAVTPTLGNLAVLAVIIGIRTLLSFALQIEIDGKLPWRRGDAETAPSME
ncbi:MAG: DUF1622 domain-containing protein [Gemmatimonas sp.]|nr:DUF1622 domain-containing protein [Gemmatimonas sp.]